MVEEEGARDPAQAFEDLRAEVSVLRRAVEAMPQAWEAAKGPDYGSDLARIAKALAVVAGEVEAMAEHPALRMTPADHQRAIGQAGADLVRGAALSLERATHAADAERQHLADIIGVIRTQDRQNRMVAWASVCGAIAGMMVWVALSGPVARVLPTAWRVPERMAAATLHLNSWDAGEAMMKSADPVRWAHASQGIVLERQNQSVLELCWRQPVTSGHAARCSIQIKP